MLYVLLGQNRPDMPSNVLIKGRTFICICSAIPQCTLRARMKYRVCAGLAIFFSISLSFPLQSTHLLTAQFLWGFTEMVIVFWKAF